MWFDSHCHLMDVADPEAAVERAHAAGVTNLLVLGVDPESSRKAVSLTSFEGVWAGAAYHPEHVKGWQDSWADEMDGLLGTERIVAVGETGIDLHWDTTYVDDQVNAFKAHIELSKKHEKTLVIHTRDSIDETAAVLEEVGPPDKLIFHCWSGDERQLQRALALGSMVSFAGNVSFKSAKNLSDVCASVPDDRLLVETDSPYLTPEPNRGKPNEPAYVAHVGAAVATARGVTPQEIADLTTANALRLFGIPG